MDDHVLRPRIALPGARGMGARKESEVSHEQQAPARAAGRLAQVRGAAAHAPRAWPTRCRLRARPPRGALGGDARVPRRHLAAGHPASSKESAARGTARPRAAGRHPSEGRPRRRCCCRPRGCSRRGCSWRLRRCCCARVRRQTPRVRWRSAQRPRWACPPRHPATGALQLLQSPAASTSALARAQSRPQPVGACDSPAWRAWRACGTRQPDQSPRARWPAATCACRAARGGVPPASHGVPGSAQQ